MPSSGPEKESKRKRKWDKLDPRPVTIKGKKLFQVDLGIITKDGKPYRHRRTFSDLKEARTFSDLKKIERENHGTRGISLSERLRAEAVECEQALAPYGATLTDATRFFIKHHETIARSETTGNAFKAFMASKEHDGLRQRYLDDLRVRIGRFVEAFADRKLAEIEPVEVDRYLRDKGVRPSTRNVIALRIGVFFAYAKKMGWVSENPVAGLDKAKVTPVEPGILSVEELARLLEAADERTLPFIALGAFSGLRTAELQRLEWKDIHWEEKLVEVSALTSKTASRRLIKMQANLLEWLAPYRTRKGKICPEDLYKLLKEDRIRAGMDRWLPNSLRHSFGSYHLAFFRSAAETALEMGHVNAAITFRYYRELVTPGEAERFWRIAPVVEAGKITAVA
jgi:integrase